jgi:transcription elongation factor
MHRDDLLFTVCDQVTVPRLLVKSYIPDFTFVAPSSLPPSSIGHQEYRGRRDPLIGKYVYIVGRSHYKGWRGEVRAVGHNIVFVAIGHASQIVECHRDQLVYS